MKKYSINEIITFYILFDIYEPNCVILYCVKIEDNAMVTTKCAICVEPISSDCVQVWCYNTTNML